MQETLEAFLEHPTAKNYGAARQLILADPEYRGDPRQLAELAELCERRMFAEAGERIGEMMPDWALSPRVHAYAAWIASEAGDAEDAELERFMQQCCLEGLLATGDGSREHPFLVMHVSDEYDILDCLHEDVRTQRLVAAGARQYDVITVANGQYWFDVTDILNGPRAARVARRRMAATLAPVGRGRVNDNRLLRN